MDINSQEQNLLGNQIFVFWWPFWIQNGCHSKPKWSPYGAACLTPCKYQFPLKSFHLKILNNLFLLFLFLYWWPFWNGGHLENFKNKEHNFDWWSIFVSSFKRISCTEWNKKKLHLGYHDNGRHFDFFSTPKSYHTLRWIFLQSFMKFDERNPKSF